MGSATELSSEVNDTPTRFGSSLKTLAGVVSCSLRGFLATEPAVDTMISFLGGIRMEQRIQIYLASGGSWLFRGP